MNRYIALVPIAILILSGTGILSQAFAAYTITLDTDSQIYDHASTIIITGHVDPVDLGGSEVTILIKCNRCGVDYISVKFYFFSFT